MDQVEFGLLGPVEARLDGRVLTLGGARPRAVLAVLLLARSAVVGEQRLVEALWGDSPPTSARNSLQSHISRLRAALGALGPRLVRSAAGYRLVVHPGELDADRVRTLVDRAREVRPHDPTTAARLLTEAVSLWRGPALAEFADLPGHETGGLAAEQVRLDEWHRGLREELLDARLGSGQHTDVLPDLEAAAAADPLRESVHRLLAIALYRCGRTSAALDVLRRFRRGLAEETGLDPTAGLAALEGAMLDRDPGLDPVGPVVPTPSSAPRFALLAPPANPFFGREAEREALSSALAGGRLVTVTGPGGVGKTRLVLQCLAELPDQEVLLLDLARLRQGADVEPALAGQLGVLPSATTPVAEVVLDVLRARRLLLVLDNCEHVVGAVLDLVPSILRHARDVRILATSRIRLGLPEEQVLPLGPLPVPGAEDPPDLAGPAVRLFLDRARRVRPGFTPTPEDVPLVAQVCRRLDGLPLAVELAAGMVGALDLAGLATALDVQKLDLPGRAGGDRHRSLRAVVDSSYALLSDSDRRLFAELSVFPDWFDLPAAQEVAGTGEPTPVSTGLVRLVDASLVLAVAQDGGRLRYRMLETLRRYGRERLDGSGAADVVTHCFIAWAVRFAEEAERALLGPDEATWVRRVEIEFANLRAAWRRALDAGDVTAAARIAVALADHAMLRSLPEPWAWALALARRPDLDATERTVAVLGAAAQASWLLGDRDAAEELARSGLARAAGRGGGRWRCLNALSTALIMRGDHEQAASCSREAANEPDSPEAMRPYLASDAVLACSYTGIVTNAGLDAVLTLWRGDWPSGRAWGWYVAAEAMRWDDPAECLRHLQRSLELARGVGSVFIEGVADVGLVAAALRVGDHDAALRRLPGVLRGWQRAGSWFQQWTTLRTLAVLLADSGADEEAVVLLGAADAAPEAPVVAGAEATAHAERLRILEARLGTVRFADAIARGSALPRSAVVEYALRTVEDLSGSGRVPLR